MRAAVFVGTGKPLEIQELPDPTPGPGEVVLKVDYCGICGSDLSYTNGSAFSYPIDFVAGHETGAMVVAVGSGVETLKIGDHVSPYPNRGCGTCVDCLEGRPYFCGQMSMNMGGFGQYMVSPAIACAKLPQTLSLADAALIEPLAVGLLGVEAAYPIAGSNVVVLGVGPIGLAATYWATRLGANRVVTAAKTRRRADIAVAMGANDFHTMDNDFVGSVIEELGGPPDVVIEAVGALGTLNEGLVEGIEPVDDGKPTLMALMHNEGPALAYWGCFNCGETAAANELDRCSRCEAVTAVSTGGGVPICPDCFARILHAD
jgi:threonine dehydrogenase-like Zn-dependent dehydrogenase